MREKVLIALLITSAVLLGVAVPSVVHATTSISQSYTTSDKLSIGSIVSLKQNTSDEVIAASNNSVDNLFGVVINADNALLSLSSEQKNQVQIATSGIVQVLVSDINGSIGQGDHITASPINGVGMKATDNVRIVGIAQGNLSGGTKQSYRDSSGKEQSTILGQVPVLINVAYYFKEPSKTIIPSAIQNIADAFAGKQVSTLPIIASAIIFIVMMIIVMSIVYSMIRSSLISIGRNPMSQSAIYRDLIQLSALVLGILAVGVIAIYLILTRL